MDRHTHIITLTLSKTTADRSDRGPAKGNRAANIANANRSASQKSSVTDCRRFPRQTQGGARGRATQRIKETVNELAAINDRDVQSYACLAVGDAVREDQMNENTDKRHNPTTQSDCQVDSIRRKWKEGYIK
jgi:hypothetical protein